MPSPPRNRVLLIALPVVVIAGIAGYLLWSRVTALPERGSPEYVEYQRSFDVGTAALEVGREDLARKNLDQAVQRIPGEPAAWANRGLLNLRKNNLEQAAADLDRAHARAR